MIHRVRRKLLYSSSNRRVIRWSQRIVMPGFEGFSLYHISRFFFLAIQQGQIINRASAIAFKLFLAFFPALIMLLTLIPYIPIPDFQARLLDNFRAMMPHEVYAFIEGMLHDLVVKKHSTLLSVSFITGLYFASNSMDAILDGFSASYHVTRWHTALKQRLLSLVLLVALTVMMVVAMALLSLSNWVISLINDSGYVLTQLEHYGLLAAKWGITVLMLLGSISLLYNAGDPTARRFRFITPGAILAVALTLLVSQALVFFFERITDYNALYGSIGAILAVQLWIYFNMIVLLIGFELNASITRARLDSRDTLRPKPGQAL
jgi:membrane protein